MEGNTYEPSMGISEEFKDVMITTEKTTISRFKRSRLKILCDRIEN